MLRIEGRMRFTVMEATLMKPVGLIGTRLCSFFSERLFPHTHCRINTIKTLSLKRRKRPSPRSRRKRRSRRKQEKQAKPEKQQEAKAAKQEQPAKPEKQQEAKAAKQEEHEAKQQDQQAKQTAEEKQEEAKAAKQEKQKQAKGSRSSKQKQEQAKQVKQEANGQQDRQQQQHVQRSPADEQTQRAEPALRLSARGEGRIPDDRFRSNFGSDHHFRIGNPEIVDGYSRFQYSGFWFGFVEPWPDGWYYTDDVYVDFVDGEYYLYNPYYPGVRMPST